MKTIIIFLISLIVIQKGISQNYYPGNGLKISNDSFHIGGSIFNNTNIKGKYNGVRYNFSLDTFALLNYNAKRIDMEANDSARLISDKLVKIMSAGDIQLGAVTSITLDGNLWLKKYKNPSATNVGLLSVDTCGRLSIASSLNLANYLKKGGNNFDGEPLSYERKEVFFGSLDSTAINFGSYLYSNGYQNKGKNNIILKPDGLMEFWATNGLKIYSGSNDHFFLSLGNKDYPFSGMISNGLRFWSYNGSFASALPSFGKNLGFYNTSSTGDAYSFGGEGFTQTGSGTSNFFNISSSIIPIESNSKINILNLESNIYFDQASTNSVTRGLYVNLFPLTSTSSVYFNNFRAIETTKGHVALNTISGNTLIGTNATNGKKLQVEGDASISEGLTLGDTSSISSALLNMNTSTKGFLPPRLTTSNRNNISNPANGLMIYNIDSSWLEVHTPNGWYKLLSNNANSGGGFRNKSASNDIIETSKSSFVSRLGDGKTKTFNIRHNLNSEFIMVQFIDCGAEANCNLLLSIPDGARIEISDKNEVQISFENAPAFNRYKVMFLKIQ